MSWRPIVLTLGAAAVAGALALPANQRGAAAIAFDPILSTGVQRVPQADRSRALIAALQKGAAKTETGPFAPPEVPAAAAIESRFRQAWAGTRGALDLGRL